MNKANRKTIAEKIKALESLRDEMGAIADVLRDFASEEREKFDNMPESLQQSEQGQAIENAADTLDNAVGYLEEGEIVAALDELVNLEG